LRDPNFQPILLDVTRLLRRLIQGRHATGIDRVVLAYALNYEARVRALVCHGNRACVLSNRDTGIVIGLLKQMADRNSEAGDNLQIRRTARWLLIKSYPFARKLPPRSAGMLLNLSHTGLEQRGAFAKQVHNGISAVFMIHDLIPLTHAEYCRDGESGRHAIRIENALNVGEGIIVNSQATLVELTRYASRARLKLPPVAVAPLGVGLTQGPLMGDGFEHDVAEPYFVMVGTLEPRKNHWLILHVWRTLVRKFGSSTPRLIVIGRRGWKCENISDLLERSTALQGMVLEKDHCSDAQMVAYLKGARALLFPSFAEGYGLPLVEALSFNVPVIASDLPVFKEIAHDVPEYADPLDGARWLELIADYTNPLSLRRAAQMERLTGFSPPTWERHFSVVDEFMEELRGRAA
jgi:glycosyltransferase involved in cell wall biosynthesis